jgi:hypothetical protein
MPVASLLAGPPRRVLNISRSSAPNNKHRAFASMAVPDNVDGAAKPDNNKG